MVTEIALAMQIAMAIGDAVRPPVIGRCFGTWREADAAPRSAALYFYCYFYCYCYCYCHCHCYITVASTGRCRALGRDWLPNSRCDALDRTGGHSPTSSTLHPPPQGAMSPPRSCGCGGGAGASGEAHGGAAWDARGEAWAMISRGGTLAKAL